MTFDEYKDALQQLLDVSPRTSMALERARHDRTKREHKAEADIAVAKKAAEQANATVQTKMLEARNALGRVGHDGLLPARVRPSDIETATYDQLARSLVDLDAAAAALEYAITGVTTARRRDSELLREQRASVLSETIEPPDTVANTHQRKGRSPRWWLIATAVIAGIAFAVLRILN